MRDKSWGIFREPRVLVTMLYLRRTGWSLLDLSYLFGVQSSSIRRMCAKKGVKPWRMIDDPHVTFREVYLDWNGERVNPGKSYREYLREAKKRMPIQR